MTASHQANQPLDPRFSFWTPAADGTELNGVDGRPLRVPAIPLPLLHPAGADEVPAKEALGEGIYAYLRQFPDCPFNRDYALLLQEGFPHYISDLASHAIMLEHKTVDAPYLRRQINGLKILALLEPDKASLRLELGIACYRLALMFQELGNARCNLLAALGYFNDAVNVRSDDAVALNYLAQVNFLIGDYPVALDRWRQAVGLVDEPGAKAGINERVERIQAWDVPDYPLVDDLETVAEALECFHARDHASCLAILEGIAERGFLLEEFNFPEFYYLCGRCRSELGLNDQALADFRQALDIDAGFVPAVEELSRLEKGGNP